MEDPTESQPVRREVVRQDLGGWISGPSVNTEPVPAEQVSVGDVLLLEDGRQAEVTDLRDGFYWFVSGRALGVAIGWKSGTSTGLLLRRGSDLLQRVAGEL